MEFREVWFVDFEFHAPAGERPLPLCVSAREWRSGRLCQHWLYDKPLSEPPYPVTKDSLFVAYYASAELGCHLALGWPAPANILDLYSEFRLRTNGLETPAGWSLLGALTYFGLDAMDAAEKKDMRELAIRGGPFSAEEVSALQEYCQADVDSLRRLFNAMYSGLDIQRAMLRGRYMVSVARMEWNGVPIDRKCLDTLRTNWNEIQGSLITTVDAGRGIYDGKSFRAKQFETWLVKENIPWPRLDSGAPDLSQDTFRQMSRMYPAAISPIHELRHSLSQMRLEKLAVGSDGRNRRILSAFKSRTSRNQPSNNEFIFGPSTWLRSLIKPPEGRAVAYVDYSQQEFGIAAALSDDDRMQHAYSSGDAYLTFAKQAGRVPEDATAESHRAQREQFKSLALGVQYGMGAATLSERLNSSRAHGRLLIELHHDTYPKYWRWNDAAVDRVMLCGSLTAAFGWTIHASTNINPRSIRNFPLQANGAEMLRLACILATEAGIQVCAPVHDALLIESSVENIESAVEETQACMLQAALWVLDGFPLRTDAAIVRCPNRYSDKRGEKFWDVVWSLIGEKSRDRNGTGIAPPVGLPVNLIRSL